MANDNYNYSSKIRALLDEMPDFVSDYILNHGSADAYLTKFEYSRDIRDFLRYMTSCMPEHSDKDIKEITLEDLENIKPIDINRYMTIVLGEANKIKPTTVKRRRATLSSMYGFFVSNGRLTKNPVLATKPVKIPEKQLIYLTNEEQIKLLNAVKYGTGLPPKAANMHNRYADRDMAMFLLLLDTGLRVSEMLSTDIIDYDLSDCSVVVQRKGGDIEQVYFSDECSELLDKYFSSQRDKLHLDDNQIPAFTTLSGERLGVRATENLVKKYVSICLPDKTKIMSPHKLRSSFAMSFYSASDNNILLLQKRMHHKSITTTNIYAKASNTDTQESRNLLQNMRSNTK